MILPQPNYIFRLFDFLLWPFMWILGGLVFPVQETHYWHMKRWNWEVKNGLRIVGKDTKAKFGNGQLLGHVPLLGGLTKYVVLEASGFKKYWNVGWTGTIQLLPIYQNRVIMLVGNNGFIAYGLGDNMKVLKLKIVGFGELGDKKYNGIRLF